MALAVADWITLAANVFYAPAIGLFYFS